MFLHKVSLLSFPSLSAFLFFFCNPDLPLLGKNMYFGAQAALTVTPSALAASSAGATQTSLCLLKVRGTSGSFHFFYTKFTLQTIFLANFNLVYFMLFYGDSPQSSNQSHFPPHHDAPGCKYTRRSLTLQNMVYYIQRTHQGTDVV